MFSFFSKKNFLADSLEGFIDIHNHILPGIDDGAKNVDESISLIKGFGEFGVKDFIATPHIMSNYYPNTPGTINNALSDLKKKLRDSNMTGVSIEAAAEHMIDDNFEAILENDQIMPLKKQYLLIEMSYLQPSINFNIAITKVASNGYFPILAHPERYVYMHDAFSKYHVFKEKGVFFQMNLLSLGGFYGKDVYNTSLKLLNEKLIDFVASDIHSMNQMKYLKEIKIPQKIKSQLQPIILKTIQSFC